MNTISSCCHGTLSFNIDSGSVFCAPAPRCTSGGANPHNLVYSCVTLVTYMLASPLAAHLGGLRTTYISPVTSVLAGLRAQYPVPSPAVDIGRLVTHILAALLEQFLCCGRAASRAGGASSSPPPPHQVVIGGLVPPGLLLAIWLLASLDFCIMITIPAFCIRAIGAYGFHSRIPATAPGPPPGAEIQVLTLRFGSYFSQADGPAFSSLPS
ncbi:hypothetical protein GOBAR_AA20536 [Gossypium barbadense]|uniref:Uncharacterized protein n=1 Tax=Gossypium barbadense TaxID=3634 RepID=A0A2P5X9X8_GOSBA|nr:hypothetical protein GOBAR_AA20536 [Gossypium barbadense]